MLLSINVGWLRFDGYGTLADYIGIISTVVTIGLTIRYYNRDRRINMMFNQTISPIDSNHAHDNVKISIMNASATKVVVAFIGFKWRENWLTRLRLRLLTKKYTWNRIRKRDNLQNAFFINHENLAQNKMIVLDAWQLSTSVSLTLQELITGLASVASKDIVRRLCKNKPVTYQIGYERYDGKLYLHDLTIDPIEFGENRENIMYSELKRILSIQ